MAEALPSMRHEDLGIGLLFEAIREAVIVGDVDTERITLWNPAAEKLFGYTAAEAQGLPLAAIVPPRFRARHDAGLAQYRATGHGALVDSGATVEVTALRKTGEEIAVELTLSPLRAEDGRFVMAVIRDVAERKRAEDLTAGQTWLLEMIARGAALPEVLDALVTFVEGQAPPMLGSVLLLDDDGLRLRHGAAPRLPDAYNRAIDGIAIGPSVGSCGTAAYTKEPVIVTDIEHDPRWADFRALAARHGLRACWSTPILSRGDRVLGTFAMYYRESRAPTERDLRLIDVATHLARIAIERERAERDRVRLIGEQAAHAEAEAERARLHEMFQQAPALIAVLSGPDHVFQYANPAYAQATGRAVGDLIGRPYRAARPDLVGQGFYELLAQVYAGGEPFYADELPAQLERGDGALYEAFFNVVYQPTRDAHGAVSGIFVHAVDVTAQVQARRRTEELAAQLARQLALMQAMTASLGEGVYALDREGRLIFMNPAAERMLGWTTDELRGRPMHDVIHFQHADHTWAPASECPLLSVIDTGATAQRDEDVFTRQDGALLPVGYTSSPMTLDGQAVGAVVAFHDITALQNLERAREEFISSAAHDLKTPLAGVKAMAQLLLRRISRPGDVDRERLLEGLRSIDHSATRLSAMVTDLLDITRLNMGQALELDCRPTDLVELARRLAAEHQQSTELHHIRVRSKEATLIGWWDAPRLERAIGNLLSNAIKYSLDGGDIAVRVQREEAPDGPWAVLSVRDEGIGIPAGERDRIFERFYRGSNAGRVVGTGIGLAGVRRIVEEHGGRVGVQSGEGVGSTFTIRLPLAAGDDPTAPTEAYDTRGRSV